MLNNALLLATRSLDVGSFRRWLEAGLDELGLTAVEVLFHDHLLPLLSDEECDRIVAWRLGVSI